MINHLRKRDGQILPFNKEKIAHAIFKAAKEAGGGRSEGGVLPEYHAI